MSGPRGPGHERAKPGETRVRPAARDPALENARRRRVFRRYNDYDLPEAHEGTTITVRLHNDEDKARKFNRTENVRPIPPSDPDFKGIYGRRSDSESINRGLEDTMYLNRAHSVGHARQHVNLLGYALMVNSLALHEHRERRKLIAAA